MITSLREFEGLLSENRSNLIPFCLRLFQKIVLHYIFFAMTNTNRSILKMKSLILISTLFLVEYSLFAQRDVLRLEGKIRENKEKLAGVKVSLLVDGEEVDYFVTENNGRFKYKLPLQKNYFMVFSKPGYRSKYINIIASNIPEDDAEFGYEFGGLDVSLYKEIKGLNDAILDKAVAQIVYDTNEYKFKFDAGYFEEIQDRMDSLQLALEQTEEEEELLALEEAAAKAEEEERQQLILEQEAANKREAELLAAIVAKKEKERLSIEQEQLKRQKEEEMLHFDKLSVDSAQHEKAKQEEQGRLATEKAAREKAEQEKEEQLEKERLALEQQKQLEKEKEQKRIEELIAKKKEREEYERKKAAYLKAKAEKEAANAPPTIAKGDLNNEAPPGSSNTDTAEATPTMSETVYRKGNKTITERKLTENGVTTIYKKVIADWGGRFFFKGDTSITEREYKLQTDKFK